MAELLKKIGPWAFTVGIILAVFAGVVPESLGYAAVLTAVLVFLGLLVGFLNVTAQETSKFLMAAVAVMIALFTAGSAIRGNLEALGTVGTWLWGIMSAINIFVFPATIVAAIKAIFAIARD